MTESRENKGLSRTDSKPLPIVKGARVAAGGRTGRTVALATPERVRASIKTGMLVTLLEDFASGKKECEPHQITAAVALLRKVLPDLQATMISGDPQLPLTIITRCE